MIQVPFKNPSFDFQEIILQQDGFNSKVKEIANPVNPQPQEVEKLTRSDLFGDAQKIMQSQSLSQEEALKNTLKYYKTKGLQVDGVDIDQELQGLSPQPEPVEEENTFMSRLQDSGEKRLEQAQEIENSDRNSFRKMLDRTAVKAGSFSDIIGAGIGEVFEAGGDVLSFITPDTVEDFVLNETARQFEQVQDSLIGKGIAKGAATAKDVYEILPENIQKDVGSLGTIGVGILDAVGAGYVAKATPKALKGAKEAAGKKTFLTQGTRDKYIAKESQKVDQLVGQISQPGKKQVGEVGAMKKALSEVDTSDIKTYDDLSVRFEDKIKSIANKQDEILPSEKVYNISDLGTKSKKGTIEVNFVENALDDMENLYEKVGEIDNLERVRELRAGNLSVKDINDIAREYNVNFGKKAFNKDGSAKFSDIGTSFENTRKGVKEQSRGLLPDDTMKTLDSELSNLYTAKNFSDDMVAKVEVLKNRIDERGFIANLSRTAGNTIDILTLGAPKELFSAMLLKGGMGKATLDSLTLQGRLAKNIKKIESALSKIEKAKDARVASNILEELAVGIGLSKQQIEELGDSIKEKAGDLADNIADIEKAK